MEATQHEPHDERMNAYYVTAWKDGFKRYDCSEGDTIFSCCEKHLRESIKREGCSKISIRRAWDWERIYMRR
jgi:hypothetical protein